MSTGAVCAYHPDRLAVDTCSQCEKDICADDRTLVAGKTVCKVCVDAIRARIAGQPLLSDNAAPVMTPPPYMSPPQNVGYGQAQMDGGYVPPVPTSTAVNAPNPARLLLGFVAGSVVGVVGTILWLVIVYFTHFNLTLIAIGIGWGIGASVSAASGQGGTVPAIMSAIIALICLGLGAYMLGFGIFSIICVALGVYQAFTLAMRSR